MDLETKAEEPVLYDADAQQRVPLRILQDGATFEVAHIFEPLDDEYIRLLIDAKEADRIEQVENFWLNQIQTVAGYEDDETGKNDTSGISFDEKLNAINDGLLLVYLAPRPASGKPARKRTDQAYHLRAFFNGQLLDTRIKLGNYSAEHCRIWLRLEERRFPVKFGDHALDSYSRGIEVLFDALAPNAEGYAGRVPLHHKETVVRQHFNGQSAATLAKKS